MELKSIPQYEGLYKISPNGKVYSCRKGRLINPFVNNRGYLCVMLYKNNRYKHFLVHRLVALAYIPNPNNFSEINHIDEDKSNNRVENLEWCSRKYNQHYNGNITNGWIKAGTTAAAIKRSKSVVQLDMEGNKLRIWESATIAAKALNICRQAIGKCCLGQYKQAGGYIWRFV